MATFSFNSDIWNNRPQNNPDGLLGDGTTVARVRRRDEQTNDNDFLASLLQAIVEMQKGRETSAQRAAARRDPVAESNRLRQTPGTPEFAGMGPGGNRMVNGQLLGPITAGSGMTPEQIARMQGPTAMNQWKFPELFQNQDIADIVANHNAEQPKWVMPNFGPNSTIEEKKSTPSKVTPAGMNPLARLLFGSDFSAADDELAQQRLPKDFNFFNLPPDLLTKSEMPTPKPKINGGFKFGF